MSRPRLIEPIRTIVAFLTLLLFCLPPRPSLAQAVPAVLHKNTNFAELKRYYRERSVQISITVTNIETNDEDTIRGTGFLVSADGLVITARHVIEPALNKEKYKITRSDAIQLRVLVDYAAVPVKWVPNTAILSNRADIAVFKIAAESGKDFPYMCIDARDPNVNPGERMTMASFRYEGNPYNTTDQTFTPNVTITHSAGPGDMYKYLGLAHPIEPSMSGGAVVRETSDRVIAVMSNVLANPDGTEQVGENYANLLQSATDLGLGAISACAPPVPEGRDVRQVKSDREFMASTCEGTFAWAPSESASEMWAFDASGNYSLRRKDLAACKSGNGWKLMRLLINTNPHGSCDHSPASKISTDVATFYGVQLVPVFRDGIEDTVEQQTWLFKNATFFERQRTGKFYLPRERGLAVLQVADAVAPSAYNEGVKSANAILNSQVDGCSGMSVASCADISAIELFARALKLKKSWHGFVRNASTAESTFSCAALDWTVRESWLKKGTDPRGNDIQLKSWILRYRGTRTPVPFEFCISPEWSEFYLRSFSPERNVEPELLHVFLSD